METQNLNKIYQRLEKKYSEIMTSNFDDLTNDEIYDQHAKLLVTCGSITLAKEFKNFLVDDNNKKILRFLLYYFNNCKLAEDVFPEKEYKIHKNIMFCGEVGVGKTLIMQAFSDYLVLTNNPNRFYNLSVTQMINYYKLNNHLDKYTYNEMNTETFDGQPYNICLNDVGMQTHLHFGTDTKTIVTDFFHARNEIWCQQGKFAHITTNLAPSEIKDYFSDEHGRLIDRFKTYNVLHLQGESRR